MTKRLQSKFSQYYGLSETIKFFFKGLNNRIKSSKNSYSKTAYLCSILSRKFDFEAWIQSQALELKRDSITKRTDQNPQQIIDKAEINRQEKQLLDSINFYNNIICLI